MDNNSKKNFVLYAQNVHSIFFSFDSATIKDDGIQKINELISQLKKVRNVKLVIYGYTDRVGTSGYNNKLALRRINAVKNRLISSGVMTANNISIEIKAVGEHDPLISHNTINNNPHSRRVDVYITPSQ
ncbi:MAG: OmpA family protein [Rickettsiales bacterium]|nr:OmpA family protein [Rickettsiales bacterium]